MQALRLRLSADDSAALRTVLGETSPNRERERQLRTHARALLVLLYAVLACIATLSWSLWSGGAG